MSITAKYAAKCSTCGGVVEVGSKIEWSKGQPVRHVACPAASTAAPARSRGTCYAAMSRDRSQWASARGMGPGHGRSDSGVPGYSSYCTDNASCRCYDCAS